MNLYVIMSYVGHIMFSTKIMICTTRHTLSLQLLPHMHHIVTPGFVDGRRWSDGAAGQMLLYALFNHPRR